MVEYQILKPPSRRRLWIVVAVVAIAVLAGVGYGAYALGSNRHSTGVTDSGKPPPPLKALTVVSSTPTTGASDVPTDQPVSVHFSAPVVAGVGMPTWNPPVAGSWVRSQPTTLTFAAAAPFIPTATETLTVPAGVSGPRTADGAVLTAPDVVTFTVAQASTERLQQLLAELGYLPVSFTSSGPAPAPAQTLLPQTGSFAWRWSTLPSSLTSLWTEGLENVITKGAVMTFENQNGLAVDGVAGQQVWGTLLTDLAQGKADANSVQLRICLQTAPRGSQRVQQRGVGALEHPRQHRRAGCRHDGRYLSRLRARDLFADGGHQPGRLPLRRS